MNPLKLSDLQATLKSFDFSICNSIIYTHPDNVEYLEKAFSDATSGKKDFHIPYKLKIQTDEYLPKEVEGVYERTDTLPDDKFTEWVEEHEMQNPPSWAIYFGLVKRRMEKVVYLIERPARAYWSGWSSVPSFVIQDL